MASLTIRNIPEDAKLRLRQVAASHGHSMEEEARQLILGLVANPASPKRKSIGQMLFDGSRPGLDLPIPARSPARIPTFDDE